MSDQRRRVLPVAVAAGLLFVFWVALSGKLDAFHLSLGLLTAVAVTLATHGLYRAPPQPMPADEFGRVPLRWRHFLTYAVWLLWQIFRSAIHVAKLILHPRLPIAPRMVRIADDLPHPVARLTLAHSITLTPGTVTVDCDDEGMLVHAIDPESAASLGGDGGPMADRVRGVFGAGAR
ncbi:MAG: Na+/H+ antiporter subunit E [Acidobacteriota bacterium]|nr:Na+/H+ antiporter subunit E [Acidobacteriota bacterium]MXW71423.1 hypothetical protein [Acidobacteriota bacterium]MYE44029.1 hypothetical protein [Acidobacteriota bacterium]MYF76218.1 hypothetical protein [Acidobacteriota bacterium]